MIQKIGTFLVSVGLLAVTGSAGQAASLLIYSGNAGDANHVKTLIDNVGALTESVDLFDAGFGTPQLDTLQSYESVMIWLDDPFFDSELIGDNLADYVDSGGGVVVATFANATGELGGRFLSGGYHPIVPSAPAAPAADLTLGTVNEPAHPVMLAVLAFSGGAASFRVTGAAEAGTTVIAEWSDGTPLVVERPQDPLVNGGKGGGIVLGLNMYPVSSANNFGGWDVTTDGDQLMANALKYAGQVPEPSSVLLLVMGLAIAGRRQRGGR